ncbi:MAG: amidohydrolase family protein [Candidatus Bipolaricaulis sp.]|nr:amidohydrolase family protein [Candidatus Bipolaricaulis sp.]
MSEGQKKCVAVVGATLIDGTGRPPVADAVVVVEGERIVAAGAKRSTPIPPAALQVDAKGRYLLPGMIDAHVHVSSPDFIPIKPRGDATAYMTALATQNLRSALQAGVTTVRDVCGPRVNLALRSAIERGQLVGPRLYTAGKGICMTGGHGSNDPDAVHQVDSPDAVRQAVREERKAGVDLIKLLTSHRTDHPEFRQEEIAAGVDEAHRFGLRVSIHAANLVTTAMAVDAGVDAIEHGSFLDEATAERMGRDDVFLVPTLWVKHDLAERLRRWQATPETFPWGDAKDLAASATWFQRCVDQLPKTMALARKYGVRIAAGTDFVLDDFPWCVLPEEVELLTRLGLSNMEAIESATRVGAEVLGLQDRLGTVEPGKLADLILVDQDPLADIKALAGVSWVMQGGRVIPRSTEWGRRPIRDPLPL